MTAVTAVTVRAPAKVNLLLAVGPVREDGYHDLVNVFHAVSLFDEVTVRRADPGPAGAGEPVIDVHAAAGGLDAHLAGVPRDGDNLAARAARLVAREAGLSEERARVRIRIDKAIPVAGGMAGGSADAAAALLACDALFGAGLDAAALQALAAELGSDVPFPLLGGTAVGTGRGEVLEPVPSRGRFHWVFALSERGLSTPAVFGEYDRLRPDAPQPRGDAALTAALGAGDPPALAAALRNDLEPAALSLRPDLARTLDAGREAGALAGIVSGSGPTCAFLAPDADGAAEVAEALEKSGTCERALTAHGDVPGAETVTPAVS
ncbi:4-(cytidine 5'-diphospho)-2-C-methyl-D-erythritol kinase [Nocardiopsis sp. RSe5-2]|uniref:4-diphosphocytidyl-2-C-methyl-D-erythritol kinase n=1 Tax=Nocardiopsis endophytica TaxID=3018445 RepID=A0ABT4U2P7_9ACTN|nr:4-(cytidine 5'-diphospho)-2-C-methyl-D-erythritol kinase [Nocardiopsis endophytica]MDA2811222.1 4-(cytidine 5'-diphospho)-2-C-methyl-D-erythritol kinase [Nocardiopsis endophytica]